ncbi:MAG: GTP-binding protein [Candidatus Lokiarchaeota archaeon]|nr:GTP-binding protein [Candidatus Lokiarchaeota archaeon]
MSTLFKFKIIVAGSKNVGKSSLIIRFCDNTFTEDKKDTIGVDFKRKKMAVEGVEADLIIWDFAGEERFRTLFPSYLNGAVGAFVLYDITNEESLKDVANWIKIIDEFAEPNVTKILIGTKKDLENQREVTKEAAVAFMKKYHFLPETYDTSSKTGEHVEEAFAAAVRSIISKKFTKCTSCGSFEDIKIKICRYCGSKIACASS